MGRDHFRITEKPKENANCYSDFAQIYIQYSCDFEDVILSQNMKGLIVTISGIIVCCVFRFSIYYRRTMSDIDANIWDYDTVTTADFAVQINLTNRMWSNWKEYSDTMRLRKKKKLCFKDFLIT